MIALAVGIGLACALWCFAACAVAGMSDDEMEAWEAETWKQD